MVSKTVNFSIELGFQTNKPNVLRKHFNVWKIPEPILKEISIPDKTRISGSLRCGSVPGSIQTKTTSGGEFRIASKIATRLQVKAKSSPREYVNFTLNFDEAEAEHQVFRKGLIESLQDSEENRQKRLADASPYPTFKIVQTVIYDRNRDVVAQRLHLANGRCEECGSAAPFLRESDNTPIWRYIMLSDLLMEARTR